MGNGLTAQKRLDKNGKLVTRYVKEGSLSSASDGAIPSPSNRGDDKAALKRRRESIRELANHVADNVGFEVSRKEIVAALESIEDRSVLYGLIRLSQDELVQEASLRSIKASITNRATSCFEDDMKMLVGSMDFIAKICLGDAEDAPMRSYYRFRNAMIGSFDRTSGEVERVTEYDVARVKAKAVADWLGVIQESYISNDRYEAGTAKLTENIDRIEYCMPVLRSYVKLYPMNSHMDIQNAVSAVEASGLEPEDIERFMRDYDMESLERSIDAMKTASRSLAVGQL